MNTSQNQIKCNVSNCQWNIKRCCSAKEIEVNSIGDGYAKTSDGTCCSTFVNSPSGG